jgi:glycosyltransferase involved in cell wall biosynthesis
VVRQPSARELRELAGHSDIVFQNNISLRTLFPLLLSRKPVVIAHHIWLTRTNGGRGWQDYLKYAVLPVCHNIAVSKAVAALLPVKSIVISDPFETDEFKDLGETNRTKDLVFMGRLVSDKGCDVAIRALGLLRKDGLEPSLTVIGDGPEMPALKRLAAELDLSQQVVFRGTMREGRGSEVAQHKIMVIPSVWAEPFGIVALEGLAAGCVLVASSAGGLPEAVGPCGILFPCGDVKALASALQELLQNASLRKRLMSESQSHLRRFRPEIVARQYMEVFESALQP